MQTCKGCNSQVYILFTLPNGDKLCDYCSSKALIKPKKIVKEINNTRFMIKQKHSTVKAFCKAYNLSYETVGIVLRQAYTKPSKGQLKVLRTLIQNNLGNFLVGEKYISEDLWWELKVTV